jgi:hypothetical protein
MSTVVEKNLFKFFDNELYIFLRIASLFVELQDFLFVCFFLCFISYFLYFNSILIYLFIHLFIFPLYLYFCFLLPFIYLLPAQPNPAYKRTACITVPDAILEMWK